MNNWWVHIHAIREYVSMWSPWVEKIIKTVEFAANTTLPWSCLSYYFCRAVFIKPPFWCHFILCCCCNPISTRSSLKFHLILKLELNTHTVVSEADENYSGLKPVCREEEWIYMNILLLEGVLVPGWTADRRSGPAAVMWPSVTRGCVSACWSSFSVVLGGVRFGGGGVDIM